MRHPRTFVAALALTSLAAFAGVPPANPPPGLIATRPDSPWRNVGFANWVDGHAGAMGVFMGVSVDPANHDRILAATQFGGLWLSENAGKT